jgi:hypothetical protein
MCLEVRQLDDYGPCPPTSYFMASISIYVTSIHPTNSVAYPLPNAENFRSR